MLQSKVFQKKIVEVQGHVENWWQINLNLDNPPHIFSYFVSTSSNRNLWKNDQEDTKIYFAIVLIEILVEHFLLLSIFMFFENMLKIISNTVSGSNW